MEGRPTSVLPDGLVRCGECSELKGQGITPDMWREWVRIRCLCDGLICGNCGQHRIHRPISNYWAENEGRLWHVPYLGYLKDCRNCGKSNWVSWRSQNTPLSA
jgi:hypothetical protein